MADSPALPYADPETGRSSGWSGTDTSKARAHREDENGTTLHRQEAVARMLKDREYQGATVQEVRDSFDDGHHGSWSATLTGLHKAGIISRLKQVRNGCKVYVLRGYEGQREVESATRTNAERIKEIHALLATSRVNGEHFVSVSEIEDILRKES